LIQRPAISLILPAYNERNSIGRTINEVAAYFRARHLSYEIIVAADGNDGTREFVKELSLKEPNLSVLGHQERSGKGRGVREAVQISRGEIVGYADADNKVNIGEFDTIQDFFNQGYEVVIGSRALRESQIERSQPWFRRAGSKAFAFCMHTLIGLPDIKDTQCGFKFFSGEAARRIFAEQKIDGYMFDVEILCLAKNMGFRMIEVPIVWHDDGDSRLNLVSGNIRNAIDLFKIRRSIREVRSVSLARVQEQRAVE
jgi:dolichyl-phosphate beta-glucosyltransferase